MHLFYIKILKNYLKLRRVHINTKIGSVRIVLEHVYTILIIFIHNK